MPLTQMKRSKQLALMACLLITGLVIRSWAGTAELLTPRLGGPESSSTADGSSYQPIFSRDGKLLVFTTAAQNIAPGSKRVHRADLAVYRIALGTIKIVTTPAGGGPGLPGVSTAVGIDGDTLVFLSDAPDLIEGITPTGNQLYALNLSTGTRRLLSKNPEYAHPSTYSVNSATLAAGGRYVFFEATGGNLVDTSYASLREVFRVDLSQSDLLEIASTSIKNSTPNEFGSWNVSVSADGNRAAYLTAGENRSGLLFPDTPAALRDFISPAVPAAPIPGNIDQVANLEIQLSGEGRYAALRVKFQRFEFPFPGHIFTNGVWWTDLNTKAVQHCSVNLPGLFAVDPTTFSSIEFFPGGRTIAFEGLAEDGISKKVWFWNADTATTSGFDGFLEFAPPISTEPSNSYQPRVSPDGLSVAFLSSATNILPGVTDGANHVYVRTLATGETRLVDRDPNGQPVGLERSVSLQFSPDGRHLTFDSISSKLTPQDLNDRPDVFLYDVESETLRLVSAARTAQSIPTSRANVLITPRCLSSNGMTVVFTSAATDLTTNAPSGFLNVFATDRATHTVSLVSANTSGVSSVTGASFDPQITRDGRYVFFISTATDLVTNTAATRINVYRRDLTQGDTIMVSDLSSYDAGDYQVTRFTFSDDGRYVVYELGSKSHLGGNLGVLRDNLTHTSMQVGSGNPLAPDSTDISAEGNLIAYIIRPGPVGVRVQDTTGTLIATNLSNSSWSRFNQNGSQLTSFGPFVPGFTSLDIHTKKLYRFTIPGPLDHTNDWAVSPANSLLAVAFQTSGSGAQQFLVEISVLDEISGKAITVSTNNMGLPALGESRAPVFSNDGKILAFVSTAPDLTLDGGVGTRNVFVRDNQSGTIAQINMTPDGQISTGGASQAALSDDGSTIVFTSSAADLSRDPQTGFGNLFAATVPRPIVRSSGPRISVRSQLQDSIALSWPSAVGVQYQLIYRSNLQTPWQILNPTIVGTGEKLSYNLSITNDHEGYFALTIAP